MGKSLQKFYGILGKDIQIKKLKNKNQALKLRIW
jgi:hypothetical protein